MNLIWALAPGIIYLLSEVLDMPSRAQPNLFGLENMVRGS
jgi:hypothetical protein